MSNWREIAADALAEFEREQAGSLCPVVDHEIVAQPGIAPDDVVIWLVCRNRAERVQLLDTEHARAAAVLRRKLLARGWPESAVDSLTVRVTSRDEVAASGGWRGGR